MQLLMSPPSPFVRKVRVTLRETGLLDQVEEVRITTSPMASDATLMSANPVAKIPTLLRDDGPAIYDSRVICRYLDARAGSKLYPESPLWEVLTLEATADAIMDAAVSMVYEVRFKGASASAEWIEAQWGKAERALNAVNDRWASHLSGPLTMGQIGIGCALGYLDLRHAERDWRAQAPRLAGWFETFSSRESMSATAPEG